MKVHTLEPISIGGNRVEPGHLAEVTPEEYLALVKSSAVEPAEVYEAKAAAVAAGERAHAEASAMARKAESEAAKVAARLSDEAQTKADGEAKTDARKRAEHAKPARPATA
mgnify:CR=1 FL=1